MNNDDKNDDKLCNLRLILEEVVKENTGQLWCHKIEQTLALIDAIEEKTKLYFEEQIGKKEV